MIKNIRMFKGVWLEDDYQRTYPYNSLASDVIGFPYPEIREQSALKVHTMIFLTVQTEENMDILTVLLQ